MTGKYLESINIEKIKTLSIFFGHQSVGADLLEGLSGLYGEIPQLDPQRESVDLPGLYHSYIGQNGNPQSKMDAFSEIVNLNSKSFDIAMMKFCYVDIDETTDITLLFSQYKEMMDELESQFPDMTFAAVTAPLMERQGGFKSFVKKILGRKIYGRADNLKRHLFNNLIRENFDIVFDLAEIESTAPDGAKLRHEMNGQEYPSLYPGYTDDGGHLNKAGRENMAYGFLKFISEIQ